MVNRPNMVESIKSAGEILNVAGQAGPVQSSGWRSIGVHTSLPPSKQLAWGLVQCGDTWMRWCRFRDRFLSQSSGNFYIFESSPYPPISSRRSQIALELYSHAGCFKNFPIKNMPGLTSYLNTASASLYLENALDMMVEGCPLLTTLKMCSTRRRGAVSS
jgi:hypothetical protein